MSAKKSGSSAKKAEPETFDTREVVLAKVRGFPPWPGMVVDPDSVPKAVSKERPPSKKSVVYAVRFFPAGDYAWLPPRELTRLTKDQINAFVDDKTKKAGDLKDGYRAALDPDAWEQEHAANPPVSKKRKTKSKSKKDEDEDELDGDEDAEEDAEEETEKAGKKRKRASSPAPAKAKPKAVAAKGKKGGKTKKSKAAVESEDDAADDGEGEDGEEAEKRPSKKSKAAAEDSNANLESDPEALKVREWRHKLQKTFLSSNKSLPKEDEMPAIDTLFTTVEEYQNMNIGYLTFSKIGKVMRHIHLLEPAKVPRDDEFHFRTRAKALVDKWQGILNSTKANGTAEGAEGESAAVTEGTARMDLNGTNEGDLTVMDVTMDESAS